MRVPAVRYLRPYQRTAGSLRRLLEAVGLERRARDITPSMREHRQS
jgi:hypothetical protein